MERGWDNVSEWAHDPLVERWRVLKDINRDGVFSISDIGGWFGYVFFSPGDGLVTLICEMPEVARFLEFTYADFGGLFSGIFSAIIWLSVLSSPFSSGR